MSISLDKKTRGSGQNAGSKNPISTRYTPSIGENIINSPDMIISGAAKVMKKKPPV